MHRLSTLAQAVYVDYRRQVVQLRERRLLERLPHRTLGQLAVAAEHPHTVGQPVEPLSRKRDPNRNREPLPQRTCGDVDPRDCGGRVAL